MVAAKGYLMNKIYQFDPGNFDVELLPTQLPKRALDVRNIMNVRDLCLWLWEQLEASQPVVAVEDYARDCLAELNHVLSLGEPVTIAPMLWAEIFGLIRWQDVYCPEGVRVSLALLAFMGKLGSYVTHEGTVSTGQACEMMLDCSFRSGRYLKYGKWSEDSRLIVSTPACERLLGVKIQVRVNGPALDEDWWVL